MLGDIGPVTILSVFSAPHLPHKMPVVKKEGKAIVNRLEIPQGREKRCIKIKSSSSNVLTNKFPTGFVGDKTPSQRTGKNPAPCFHFHFLFHSLKSVLGAQPSWNSPPPV